MNKNELAIDTSNSKCSVALRTKDDNVITKIISSPNHCETLMPLIKDVFNEANMTINDIDYIYVVDGPGSFTGLRIGIATAKSLAHFSKIPIIPIKSLTYISWSLPYILEDKKNEDFIIAPLIDARRQTFYTQFYDKNYKNPISEIMHLEINEIIEMLNKYDKKIYLMGENLKSLLNDISLDDKFIIFDEDDNILRPKGLLEIGDVFSKNTKNVKTYKTLTPFYVKKSQAEREYDEKNGVK